MMDPTVDIDLLVAQLRRRGREVTSVVPTSENAGTYELLVDGQLLTLSEARLMLEDDQGTLAPPITA